MLEDVFVKLGDAPVVATLMGVDYKTAWRWRREDKIPRNRRLDFIEVCKRHGITVTLQELSGKK